MENVITYDFGYAIKELKEGFKVRRQGWNGKGMFLWLYTGVYSLDCDDKKIQGNGLSIQTDNVPENFFDTPVQPFILIKTADNAFVPWTPSQTDVLATDWERA